MPCPNHPQVASGLNACARCGKQFCPDCLVELDGRPYDAGCKEEQIRDLKSGSTGPDLAGAGRRFAGIFIDGLVLLPVTIYMTVHYSADTSMFDHYLPKVLLPAALWVIYEALMLSSGGQTLGKKAVGTKVVNADGSDLKGSQAWTRTITRQLMSITYILALIDDLMIFSAKRRTLHDRFAKTLVVNWKR
jgi:uncharacterized RDD family membrane protein YckC